MWGGYGLGDLDDAPFARSRWWVSDPDGAAAALLYDWGGGEVLITYGAPDALAELVPALPLPATFDLHCRAEHRPAVERVLDDSSRGELVAHRRLGLHARDLRPAPAVVDLAARRLTPDDVPAMQAVYAAHYPGNFFDPARLAAWPSWGAFALDGALVGIAGTHVVSFVRQVAAIGDIVTAGGWRGRGVAGWLVTRLVESLREDGVRLCVLNVEATNEAGQRCYRRLGFGAGEGLEVAHLEGHGLTRRGSGLTRS